VIYFSIGISSNGDLSILQKPLKCFPRSSSKGGYGESTETISSSMHYIVLAGTVVWRLLLPPLLGGYVRMTIR
jgi:hypothetical protein